MYHLGVLPCDNVPWSMGIVRLYVRTFNTGRTTIVNHSCHYKSFCGDWHHADRSLDHAQYLFPEIGSKIAMVGRKHIMGSNADPGYIEPGDD